MKFPPDFQIVGEKLILIPYKSEHVIKYHGWMEDSEILRLTGSERLTLEEEFAMQKTWEEDQNKATFIIMEKESFEESKDELISIVGDTNLFFQDNDDAESSCAEIEVMIAEKCARRKGLAKEAVQMMMKFGHEELKRNTFIAKIKCDNSASIDLFTKLNFCKVSESAVFREITMVRKF